MSDMMYFQFFVMAIAAVGALLEFLISIFFAVAVYRACRYDEAKESGPVLVGAWIWMLATLFGGPFVAGLYWVLNRSALQPRVLAHVRPSVTLP